MNNMEWLKPNLMKIIFTLLLTSLFVLFNVLTVCPAVTKVCDTVIDDEGITSLIGAKTAPLGCQQTCTEADHTAATLTNIGLKIFLPILLSYLVICGFYSYIARRSMPD